MEHKSKATMLDIAELRWGSPPVALLPRSLRLCWSQVVLPHWVSEEAGLPEDATLGDLGPRVWDHVEVVSPRFRSFLSFTMQSRLSQVLNARCVDKMCPAGLTLSDIGWTARTRNALERAGLLQNPRAVTRMTFGELADVRGLGAVGFLDFSATLEAAIDQYETLASDLIAGGLAPREESLAVGLRELGKRNWAAQISSDDPRFADLLPPAEGTIRDRVELLLADLDPTVSIEEGPQLVRALVEIERRILGIRGLTIEEALLQLLRGLSGETGERLNAIADRLGWRGSRPCTLQESAGRLGLSRERVRQIESRAMARLPDHEVFMPSLDEALTLLSRNAPVSVQHASTLLREAGLTAVLFHAPSVLAIAGRLGKSVGLKVIETEAGEVLIADEDADLARRVLRMARRLSAHSGVSNTFQLQSALESSEILVDTEKIETLLKRAPGCQSLGEGWFEIADARPSRSLLGNTIRKILCVTSPQTIGSIREGIRRVYRFRGPRYDPTSRLSVPPLDVLAAFVSSSSDFVLEGDLAISRVPLDYLRELGEPERVMVDVLRSSPAGVLDRGNFLEACVSRGMNENTFSVYTTYSPILEHIGTDLWKLRGAVVDPAAVEAVRLANKARPKTKRVLGYGWKDGNLWIAVRLPKHGRQSLVVACPTSTHRFLQGEEFECWDKATNRHCGRIVVDTRGMSHGYTPFIQQYGLDEDDILLAEFDTRDRTVLLSIGEEELLDDVD